VFGINWFEVSVPNGVFAAERIGKLASGFYTPKILSEPLAFVRIANMKA